MASLPQTEAHRDTAKARRQLRRKEYKLLHRIQRNLERQYKTPILDEGQLAEAGVIRGAPFDIDTHDVLDFDSRYFLAGSAEDVDRGMDLIRLHERHNVDWHCYEPIKCYWLRNADAVHLESQAVETSRDAQFRDLFCYNNTTEISGWANHCFVSRSKAPYFRQTWESPHDGKPHAHVFHSGHFFMWPDGPELDRQWEYNSNVPHAMATVCDSRAPRNGGLLRSELLMAIRLIKTQMADPHTFLDHRVCPVLVISFHGRFSARLVQGCVENGRFIVRPSRILNMHVATITDDVRLVLQWMNCRPVGDTRFPTKENELVDKEDSVEDVRVGFPQIKCEQLA